MRRSLVGRMYDLEKKEDRGIQLVHEDCRNCGANSRYMHPSGVLAGRWRCYRCQTWQGDVAKVPAGG